MYNIRIEKTAAPKQKPGADDPLKFGTIFTDHMFVCDYIEGQGWVDPRIVPYQPLALDPSCMVFHYGQEMFEGESEEQQRAPVHAGDSQGAVFTGLK